MKKHYTFIPLKDNDISAFRKALIGTLWFRPFFCMLTLAVLGVIGYIKRNLLLNNGVCLIIYALGVITVIYTAIPEFINMHQIRTLHKSNLLPFIHTAKEDGSFYSEEITNGFIVQTEPVNYADIIASKASLAVLSANCADHTRLITYLDSCINSTDEKLINKGVIYIEIIASQLEKGNKDILATYDKLVNCKEELL